MLHNKNIKKISELKKRIYPHVVVLHEEKMAAIDMVKSDTCIGIYFYLQLSAGFCPLNINILLLCCFPAWVGK